VKATGRFENVRDLIAEILADVLGIGQAEIDRDKDFFEIGGSSVLVPQVAIRISDTFDIRVTSTLLYENPEIDELAHAIIEHQDQHRAFEPHAGGMTLRADRDRAPASFGQQQLWLLEQLAPEACAYNVVAGYRIRGRLSVAAFRWALRAVTARHEVFRVVFEVGDGAVTQVAREVEPPVVEVDAGDQDWALVEQRTPFDLATGPLLRARVVRYGDDDHTIYLAMHHIITDDFSSSLMIRELSAFYGEFTGGPAADVPALTVQYGDMAAWQQDMSAGSAVAAELDYWRTALDGVPVVLDLPTDRPRPPVQSFAGAVLRRPLSGGIDLLSRAATLGKRVGATPFMVLISAFGALLSSWADADDLVVGTPVADRDGAERQSMLGFLLNTVAMRLRIGGDTTFLDLVDQVRETALGAYAHQHLPFNRVVDMLAPERELSRNPVAQVMFILHTARPERLELPGLRIDTIDVPSITAKFDITLSLIPVDDDLIAEWEYATDLFDRATVESLAAAFDALLDAALATPDVPASGLPAPVGAGSCDDDKVGSALTFWRHNLAGELPVLAAPSDRPRPSTPTGHSAQHQFVIDTDTTQALQAFTEREAVPEFAVFTAAYQTLLARLSRANESIVGMLVTDRRTQAAGGAGQTHTDLVCLRTRIGTTDDVRTLAQRVIEVTMKALVHRDVPYDRIVEAVAPLREPGVAPVFQAMVVYQNSPSPSIDLSMMQATARRVGTDLALFAEVRDGRLCCTMEYNADLFDADRIDRWCAMLVALLAAALADPNAPMMRLQLAPVDSAAQADVPAPDVSRTVVDLIDAAITEWPDRIACVHEGAEWTFREFDQRVRLIMSAMRSAGWSSADVIGVAVGRGVDLPAALLAVLRLGAAYLPINPGQPAQRSAAMLADAKCACVLGFGPAAEFEGCELIDLAGDLDGRYADTAAATVVGEQAAYVIFTSGSTGRPKGVRVPHRALAAVLRNFAELLGIRPGERWLSVTRPTFDIAALELFLPLAFGGELEIASDAALTDPAVLAHRLSTGGINIVQGTPTLWRAVIDEGWSGTAGLRVLCGGEELTRDLADKLVTRAARAWNVYGPTETTIWSTVAEIGPAPLSIGTALPGEHAYVVDDHGALLPAGVVGELWIGGIGVADGYVDRDDLVAERFRPDPFGHSGRVYRTGDLVERRPDGSLRFHGRLDQQVKLRGHRIEPAEIESVLRSAPGVRDAAVVLRQDSVRGAELVAFVHPDASGAALQPADLARHCAERLPTVMVPSAIAVLSELPTTSSGKIDRSALARTAGADQVLPDDWTRAEGTVEEAVAEVFGELLGIDIDDVPAGTSFFALGGHSLTAARAVNRLRDKGFNLSLRDLFVVPTVRGLASLL
jgi:amino acid adenylation domain-containing protein